MQSIAMIVDRDMRRQANLSRGTKAPESAPGSADVGPPTNYLDLYGLSKAPFVGSPDGGGYILFGSNRRAFEQLLDHVINGSGVIVLQGEEGVGKTETLRSAAAIAAESGLQTIMISRPPNGRADMIQFLSALQAPPGAGETATHDITQHFLAPPRKALFVDDIDLLPGDCVRLLLLLAQQIQANSVGSSIVLSSSDGLTADEQRPDLSKLVGLIRNTIRMSRLGPAEVQQYIERSLWIAGGTTRRLITSDAMKSIIARSGGVPGVTNRLMEGVLTAGFARGDQMITAKTVAAAVGPTAPRPHHTEKQPSGVAAYAIQFVAAGLLILGMSMFLYKGLSGHPPLASDKQKVTVLPSAPTVAAPLQQPPVVKPTETLPPSLMAALVRRGDQSLVLGDISAARLLYQRAAEAGNASAATALGRTYDPNYDGQGQASDPARAAEWYQKAITLGDSHASELLQKLR